MLVGPAVGAVLSAVAVADIHGPTQAGCPFARRVVHSYAAAAAGIPVDSYPVLEPADIVG